MGIMEKKMETTLVYYFGLYRDYFGLISRLYGDNGKEAGSYFIFLVVGSREYSLGKEG